MSLLVLDKVSLHFGSRTILSDLSLRIGSGERIGLVGPNGSGKTTLLRIIAGQQEIDGGALERARGVRIGYLPQELAVEGGRTLLDFILSSVPGRTSLDEQLAEAEAELERVKSTASEEVLMELAATLAELHERIDHFERFFSEHEALGILAGLGFTEADRDRDLSEFSGGWQMRAVLAGLLFQQPDLLLLDEPTNHLDMPSVAWFSDFLKRYKHTFILISHDRDFLNEQIDRVVTFEVEGVRQYKGNYDEYVRQRDEEEEILVAKAKNIAREKEQMQRFIDRFRSKASKAASVQSRVKALEKLDDVEVFTDRRVMRFSFPPTARTAGEVVRIEGLRKAYGDHVVFPGLDLSIRRGDKIGIIGVNGAGKTTLLKMIAGELPADGGEIVFGRGVEVGYYAQHHADTLHQGNTVYQEVAQANPDESITRVRSILGAFLFSGDDVDKPVSVLSGGERARVALARLLVNPGNLLLMDEPTNHLDLRSSESLAESLATFDGTLVFVSHNRALIRTLATKIWNVENGTVEPYPGTLDEYIYTCNLRAAEARARSDGKSDGRSAAPATPAALADAPTTGPGGKKRTREDDRARKRREAEIRKKRSRVLGPLQKKVASLEERIGALEAEQARRSEELSDPEVYADDKRRNQLLNAFQDAQQKLDELTARWEHSTLELEAAESELDGEEAALDAG